MKSCDLPVAVFLFCLLTAVLCPSCVQLIYSYGDCKTHAQGKGMHRALLYYTKHAWQNATLHPQPWLCLSHVMSSAADEPGCATFGLPLLPLVSLNRSETAFARAIDCVELLCLCEPSFSCQR